MSDPFFAPVKKNGSAGGRGGPKKQKVINPAPKLDTGKKRKQRGDEGQGGRRSKKATAAAAADDDDDGDHQDEIGAGGIDDMDLEFRDSEGSEDEALNETAAQKRLRLAKNYITALEAAKEDEYGYDAEEIDRDNIASRLQQDALEVQGRLHRQLAQTFQFPVDVKTAMKTCRGHQGSATAIAATENGLYGYSGSKDGSIIKWDLKTGKKLKVFAGGRKGVADFEGHTDHVIALAVSSDSKYLASGGKDKKVHLWSIEEDKHIHCFKHQHKDTITSLAFRKGANNQLYSASCDRTVKLWNVDELSYIETLFGHQDSIMAVDSLSKEHCVTTGGRDRTVRLWKIVEESQLVFRGGGFIRPKKLTLAEQEAARRGRDGDDDDVENKKNKVGGDGNGPEMVAKPGPDGGFVMVEKKDPVFLEGSMDCIAMIDEENFLTGGDSGTISLWNVNKKKAVYSMPLAHGFHTQPLDYSSGSDMPSGGVETPYWITALATLRYSDMFISGSWDGTIRVWQIGKNMKSFGLISKIPAIGFVNDLQLYQPSMSKRTVIVAAIGQEHKLGRWQRIKEARNGMRIIDVARNADKKTGGDESTSEDEDQ